MLWIEWPFDGMKVQFGLEGKLYVLRASEWNTNIIWRNGGLLKRSSLLNLALAIAAWSQFLNKVNKYMQKRWLYKLKHGPKHNPPLVTDNQATLIIPCLWSGVANWMLVNTCTSYLKCCIQWRRHSYLFPWSGWGPVVSPWVAALDRSIIHGSLLVHCYISKP